MLITVCVLIHVAVSLTAARWWLRPLMLRFDKAYGLKPCKDSDFNFFCFTWSIVLVMMALYVVWRHTLWPVISRPWKH